MGKRLIQQARGKGGPTYRAPSFKYEGRAKFNAVDKEIKKGIITDIIHCRGHSAPLIEIKFDNNERCLMIAPEGIRVGDEIFSGDGIDKAKKGYIMPLKNVPEGALIFNIESQPGDGGKFVRSSGSFAKVLTKTSKFVIVQFPSKKQKKFNPNCRVCIGNIAGGGRVEKPILKAGIKYFKMKAKNKLWPKVSGGAQNAVDHPFGNARSSRKSKARPAPRNAPPGRKVGMIAARRTGKKKRKK
tara:strand:- start:11525 stop:12250 length:726 start_codon:yes stop_codon:yes gene_type:complete